jgi:hypothetical protein
VADYWQLEESADQWQLEESTDLWLLEESGAEPKVPFTRKTMSTVLAAWALAPVLLWTNGFTIPETSANVPLNREWVEVVNRQWEPVENPRQARRFAPPEVAAAPDKVPYVRLRPSEVWYEPEAQPEQARQLQPPPTPDDIVFGRRPISAAVTQAWVTAEWEAQRAPRTPQEFVVAAEQPPYVRRQIKSFEDELYPRQGRRFTPQETVAAPDSPIPGYRPWLKTALGSWTPAPVLIWQNGVLVPDGVDQVSTDRLWLDTVVRAWEPSEYSVQRRARIVESGAAPQVDSVVFRRNWLQIVSSWEQELVPLWGGFGVQVDEQTPHSRLWLEPLMRWEVPTWNAQTVRHLVQEGPPVVEKVSFHRNWIQAHNQWVPLEWKAQRAPTVDEEGPIVIPNTPRTSGMLAARHVRRSMRRGR